MRGARASHASTVRRPRAAFVTRKRPTAIPRRGRPLLHARAKRSSERRDDRRARLAIDDRRSTIGHKRRSTSCAVVRVVRVVRDASMLTMPHPSHRAFGRGDSSNDGDFRSLLWNTRVQKSPKRRRLHIFQNVSPHRWNGRLCTSPVTLARGIKKRSRRGLH